MTRHSAAQQLIEARQIAKEHGLLVVDCPVEPGKTDYVVYRRLPDGRKSRLGKRTDPVRLRQYVAKLTNFH